MEDLPCFSPGVKISIRPQDQDASTRGGGTTGNNLGLEITPRALSTVSPFGRAGADISTGSLLDSEETFILEAENAENYKLGTKGALLDEAVFPPMPANNAHAASSLTAAGP